MKTFLILTGIIIVELFVLYIIGSFIAWNINPLKWWLLTTIFGRISFFILLIMMVVGTFEGWNEFDS